MTPKVQHDSDSISAGTRIDFDREVGETNLIQPITFIAPVVTNSDGKVLKNPLQRAWGIFVQLPGYTVVWLASAPLFACDDSGPVPRFGVVLPVSKVNTHGGMAVSFDRDLLTAWDLRTLDDSPWLSFVGDDMRSFAVGDGYVFVTDGDLERAAVRHTSIRPVRFIDRRLEATVGETLSYRIVNETVGDSARAYCTVTAGRCEVVNDSDGEIEIQWQTPSTPGDHEVSVFSGSASWFARDIERVTVR